MNSKFFVPFETATQLKEKGYNGKVDYYYMADGQRCLGATEVSNDTLDYENNRTIAAPTYHEVIDWLEGKGIYITTFWSLGETDEKETWKIWWKGFMDIPLHEEQATAVYTTREEALNAAILRALEMI